MRKNISGFTLIELMVVITILGISITLAVPSWNRVTQKRLLTSTAERVAASLAIAQTEAQKRSQAVSLSYNRTDDQHWCVGASVGSGGCDCTETDSGSAQYCTIDGTPTSLANEANRSVNLINATDSQPAGGNSLITFDPVRGILEPAGDKLQLTFESSGGQYQLRVIIGPTGLLKICNPDSDKSVGGYSSCVS
jgi:prepilin-type N-terminal cleavage/methylation domain-containing protein